MHTHTKTNKLLQQPYKGTREFAETETVGTVLFKHMRVIRRGGHNRVTRLRQ